MDPPVTPINILNPSMDLISSYTVYSPRAALMNSALKSGEKHFRQFKLFKSVCNEENKKPTQQTACRQKNTIRNLLNDTTIGQQVIVDFIACIRFLSPPQNPIIFRRSLRSGFLLSVVRELLEFSAHFSRTYFVVSFGVEQVNCLWFMC